MSFNQNSQALIGAIQEIPATSFNRNPINERAELLEIAQKIDKDLTKCELAHKNNDGMAQNARCINAILVRILELRKKIDKELNNSTTDVNALQLSKSQVLRVIDEVVLQLIPNPFVQASDKPMKIRILPKSDDRDNNKIFVISSFTQGTNGSVSIDQSNSLLYKSSYEPAKADSFTVSIQDLDGDSVVKTISINARPNSD